ncbi:hypothetical protein SK128_010316 [Halocaridina rubra]|uniref:CRAL-TRIO domain-containing protein n=1 Tax=Halocaridina rubra TaxID=373956 RepID=A0AAN8WLU0_HALRR
MDLQTKVEKLKEKIRISGKEFNYINPDDRLLRRYLVAHKKVDAAYERIIATEKWRKDNEVAKINSETPGVVRANGERVARVLGERDIEGRPVVYVAVRNHSFINRNIEDWTLFIIHLMEGIGKKFMEEGPHNVSVIFDLKDFTLACMDYPVAKVLCNVMQDHYPERLYVCLILNSPAIFAACWAIIKGWVNEHTGSKIKFIKGDEELSNYIDLSFIPTDM